MSHVLPLAAGPSVTELAFILTAFFDRVAMAKDPEVDIIIAAGIAGQDMETRMLS